MHFLQRLNRIRNSVSEIPLPIGELSLFNSSVCSLWVHSSGIASGKTSCSLSSVMNLQCCNKQSYLFEGTGIRLRMVARSICPFSLGDIESESFLSMNNTDLGIRIYWLYTLRSNPSFWYSHPTKNTRQTLHTLLFHRHQRINSMEI
jgi:hypothetical protein